MLNISTEVFYDKVYGCWIGKSIGGTLGAPFEGKQMLLDVTDFHSPSGRPIPNDDLDLQLVWLKALEDYGPQGVGPHVLGEYWINYIPPHWNEYGICKSNMKAGLLPPCPATMRMYGRTPTVHGSGRKSGPAARRAAPK